MYTKHNRDKTKLKIFSFIPQQQYIQPNFMNHTYQRTQQKQPEQPKQQHQRGFHHQHKAFALTNETTQFLEYLYSNFTIN